MRNEKYFEKGCELQQQAMFQFKPFLSFRGSVPIMKAHLGSFLYKVGIVKQKTPWSYPVDQRRLQASLLDFSYLRGN
jgi:hypothetical protein